MSEDNPVSCVAQIGVTAGLVWKALVDDGPQPMTKLIKNVGETRDLVLQAVGWLAREDKIVIAEEKRSKIVSLRE
jgi:hypothetical protein